MFDPPWSGGILSLDGFSSNGERIYFSATSERGTRIRYRGGPRFGGMMMGRLSCASCHGTDGRGGVHVMHMQTMDAPDIRWETLGSPDHGGHDDPHASEETLAYDEALFVQALREGIAPGGERLSSDMPRWEMSEADFSDLIEFLKSLP